MPSLQLLFRASHAALLLVLCLQLGTNKAQDDNIREVMSMNMQMPRKTTGDEEVTVKLTLKTDLRECMVVKSYLVSNTPIDGPFNYKYTACLCDDYPRNFYWDFQTNQTAIIVAVADVIRQTNICPNDEAVIPIKANRFTTWGTLFVA